MAKGVEGAGMAGRGTWRGIGVVGWLGWEGVVEVNACSGVRCLFSHSVNGPKVLFLQSIFADACIIIWAAFDEIREVLGFLMKKVKGEVDLRVDLGRVLC